MNAPAGTNAVPLPAASAAGESYDLFRCALQGSPIPMALAALDGRFVEVNPALCDFLGYDADTLCSLTWQEVTHPGDLRADLDQVGQVAAGTIDSYRMTKRYLRAGGAVVVGGLHVSGVRDETGALCLLFAQIVDVTERRRTFQARVESEEQYRLLAEATSDVVTLTTADGELLWGSPSWRSVLQRDPDEMRGTRLDVVHPEDQPAFQQRLAAAVGAREPSFRMRLRLLRLDGETLWMDGNVNLVYADDGMLAYTRSSMRDVTHQVAAERELADSEERYRMLAEHSLDVVLRLGLDRTIKWASPSARAAFGVDPDELVGHRMAELLHPDHVQRFEETTAKWRANGGSGRIRTRFRVGDDEYRWFEEVSSPLVGDDGQAFGRVIRLRDIEAETQNAESLAASEELFRRAMADSGAGIALVSTDGRYLEVNAALCDFLGYDASALKSRTWQDVTHPDDLSSNAVAAAALSRGEIDSYRVVKRYLRPDGSTVVGDVTVSAIRAADGSVVRLVSQIVDVTEQQRVARELAESEEHFRLLAENTTDLVVRTTVEGKIEWVSRSVTEILGYQPDAVAGLRFADLIHPDDVPAVRRLERRFRKRRSARFEARVRDVTGAHRWFSFTVSPIRDQEDPRGLVASARDIDAEVAARTTLATREAEFRLLAENASDVVVRTDGDGRIEWVSPSVARVMGYRPEALVGRRTTDFVAPDDLQEFLQARSDLRPGLQNNTTARVRRADGSYGWFSGLATILEDGDRKRYVIGLRDIDSEVEALVALRASEARFRAAMASAPGGMAVLSLDRRFVEVNDALVAMLARSRDWLLAHSLDDVLHPDDLEADLALRRRVGHGQADSGVTEARLIRASGAVVWVQHALALLRQDGTASAFVSQFVDITSAKQARDDLEFLARHDPLTRLANRRALVDSMARILSHRPRGGLQPGLLYVDVDGLKPVNDVYGHTAGDELIVQVADRISAGVRAEDLVARIGGDEFVVLLPAARDIDDVVAVGEKIRRSVAETLQLADATVRVTASVGATLAGPGEDPETVIKRADAALYRAKEAGRNRTVAAVT